jgi:hypothetical protein
VNRAFDELEGTMRSTSTQGKMTSCQAAIIFMTGDSVAAASELNTVFNERNDDALGARLFLYTMGRDLGAVPSSSPVCTSVGGDIGKVAKEGDIIDQLQGFFRLGAASIKTTAERVVRWWGAAHARSRTTFHLVSGDISVDAMAAKLLEVPNSKYGRSYAFLIDRHVAAVARRRRRRARRRRHGDVDTIAQTVVVHHVRVLVVDDHVGVEVIVLLEPDEQCFEQVWSNALSKSERNLRTASSAWTLLVKRIV